MQEHQEYIFNNLMKAFEKTLSLYEKRAHYQMEQISSLKSEVYTSLYGIEMNTNEIPFANISSVFKSMNKGENLDSPKKKIQKGLFSNDSHKGNFKLFTPKSKPVILNSSFLQSKVKSLSQPSHSKSKSETKLKNYLKTDYTVKSQGKPKLKKTHSLSSSMTVSSYMDKLESTPQNHKEPKSILSTKIPKLFK